MNGLIANWIHQVCFPRYFHEFVFGDIKSRLCQTQHHHETEFEIEFLGRKNGKWETIGSFRYVDMPNVKKHLYQAEEAMKALLTQD